MKDEPDEVLHGPVIRCTACGYEALNSDLFEFHELSPDVWRWFCLTSAMVLELSQGK